MSFQGTELVAGTEALVTTLGIFSPGNGVIPALSPLMLDEESGALVVYDGAKVGKAIYVSTFSVDTDSKSQAQVYKCGVLNVDALNWPETVSTLSQRVAAFAGSGISVQPLSAV
ncbi:head decoration protein [Buttiauxella selenatireducens]|uniref:Head decoration protein n=1 Tax=Buttiauxella selenatireducens TaxID=3073902 RepID=A0ABY9S5Q4_9ENTR|nr:head decoration protein [Buttiauxella sp. R73]WMY72732.1 head decoration protein [Buttiauxella sp. R73]